MEANTKEAINGLGKQLIEELTGEVIPKESEEEKRDKGIASHMEMLQPIACRALRSKATQYLKQTEQIPLPEEKKEKILSMLRTTQGIADLAEKELNPLSELLLGIGVEYIMDPMIVQDLKKYIVERSKKNGTFPF